MAEAGKNRRSDHDIATRRTRNDCRPRLFAPVKPKAAEQTETHRCEISEAAIDETLADSSPASDPPSWNGGIDRHT
jgi:hypothetical protein